MSALSKGRKPDNFEPHKFRKLRFNNIWDVPSNFLVRKSFFASNSPDILVLCQTNFDDSFDSETSSMRGYLYLIRRNSITDMHGFAVYVKEGLPFAKDLSPKNSVNSCLCFRLALRYSVLYFFFLYRGNLLSLYTQFWCYFI